MDPAFAEGLVEHVIVAPFAQLVPGSLGFQRISRVRFAMTLVAHPACHRPVDIIVEDTRHVGAVRVMAAGAACCRHWIIHMLPGKNRSICLVTPGTKRGYIVFQQEFTLGRSMGIVAGCASFFHWVMLVFYLFQLLSHGLVTGETEAVAGFEEIVLAVSGMGIMTFHASALNHDLVRAGRSGNDHGTMALGADLCSIGL